MGVRNYYLKIPLAFSHLLTSSPQFAQLHSTADGKALTGGTVPSHHWLTLITTTSVWGKEGQVTRLLTNSFNRHSCWKASESAGHHSVPYQVIPVLNHLMVFLLGISEDLISTATL